MIAEKYDKWMDKLVSERRLADDIYHRIIPRYLQPELFEEEWNQVPVTYDEHFKIHKMLYLRDRTVSSLNAWFCVYNLEFAEPNTRDVEFLFREVTNLFTGEANPFWGRVHTEESKQAIRESKIRLYEDPTVRLKVAERSRLQKNRYEFSEKEWEATSIRHTGEGNPMYGYTAWTNPWANLTAWSRLDEIYDFYTANKHKKRGWGRKAAGRVLGLNESGLEATICWVRENGNPRLNKEWKERFRG